MNVSKNDEQVVARKAGGLNPAVIIPILLVIGICIWLFVLGSPGNFKADPRFLALSPCGSNATLTAVGATKLDRLVFACPMVCNVAAATHILSRRCFFMFFCLSFIDDKC